MESTCQLTILPATYPHAYQDADLVCATGAEPYTAWEKM